MKKQFVSQIEPSWIHSGAQSLGKIRSGHDREHAPDLWEIMLGIKKFTHYFQNPGDKSKTKYYLCSASTINSEDLLLLDEYGFLFRLSVPSSWSCSTEKLLFLGVYFREQGAPASRVARGGFMQCGDNEGASRTMFLEGFKIFHVQWSPDNLNSMFYNDASLHSHLEKKTRLKDDVMDAFEEKWLWGTISFKCLVRLASYSALKDAKDDDLWKKTRELLRGERLVLVDATSDSRRNVEMTKKQAEAYREEKEKLTPSSTPLMSMKSVVALQPARGFVCTSVHMSDGRVVTTWHRSGNTLFQDTVTHKQFVMGTDEDTYFGCELKDECGLHDSAPEALLSLAPREARLHPQRKTSVLKEYVYRQGEWFFVPHEKGQFPTPETHPAECVQFETLHLPRETVDDATHYLASYSLSRTGDDRAWVHLPTGNIWCQCGLLSHSNGDHADLEIPITSEIPEKRRSEMCWKVVRNLAAASYSEAGVD